MKTSFAALERDPRVREVEEHCLCSHVQRASRALARRFDEALRPCDLTSWQFTLLTTLDGASVPSLGALADKLVMDRTTLTANLKPLERRGLVTIRPDPRDRRVRRLALSKRGRALIAKAQPYWQQAQAATTKSFSPREAADLRRSLSTLCVPAR